MRRSAILLLVFLLAAVSCERGAVTQPRTGEGPSTRGGGAGEPPDAGETWIRLGSRLVRVNVADDAASRAKGLSGRTALADDEGMIFLYPTSAHRSFWMKGCLIGLDIAYADEQLRIFQIGSLDPPPPDTSDGEMPRLRSTGEARYVVEMRHGWFADHGVAVGTRVELSPELVRRAARVVETEGG